MSLDLDEYLRYGRQMIVPEFGGLNTQLDLKNASILIIGAGGLGCPAIAYLAGAGIGTLTIVDGDTVEASNLHRQVAHSTATVGEYKVVSAAKFVANLNPHVNVRTVTSHLTLDNVFDVIRTEDAKTTETGPWDFDVILDCSDNPATRYLVNDAAVLAKTPVVSASALKTEGQLCLLNFQGGPCYRCLFPVPPPANSVVACGDGGILGPVVGMLGVYQALEAIKIVAKIYEGPEPKQQYTPALMLFSALSFPSWRNIRMRGAKPGCAACDPTSHVTRKDIETRDYVAFCGHADAPRILPEERISAGDYDYGWHQA
ncbi:uncharacterized protein SAPINGB_P002183 [Magnusiomyces paraingens]|uniref:THIF-type NAD/FAD binding fold domain-containing protein n=1 Tax=Magnusiomyces paraingens TaxID=2606893 RepID=A0A5E8BEU4_9ASCO|nr:uncharacterized protein SAPINGB_P002183 [Saprochaete ingens]VVT49260.1 unnamed protein product [Saprochaete ingens]